MRLPTPGILVDLSKEYNKYSRTDADILVLISNELDQLRSERPFHPLVSDSELVDRDILHRCALLAANLRAWQLGVTSAISPLEVGTETPSPAMSAGHHQAIYSDDWTAGLLNQGHRIGIIVGELAITRHLNLQYKGLLAEHEIPSLQQLRQDVLEHVYAICASVPQLLASGRIEAAKGLLWPLYVAAQLDPKVVASDATTRRWIVEKLRTIAFERGVRQAVFLVDVLAKRLEVTDLLCPDHGSEDEGDADTH